MVEETGCHLGMLDGFSVGFVLNYEALAIHVDNTMLTGCATKET
jgi:hypothetical protein